MTKTSELDELLTRMKVSRVPLSRSRGGEEVAFEESEINSSCSSSRGGTDANAGINIDTKLPTEHTKTSFFSTPFMSENRANQHQPNDLGTSTFVSFLHDVKGEMKNSPLAPSKLPSLDENDSKKFRVFIAPAKPKELEAFCFRIIGQGETFCLNKNCKISHRKKNGKQLIEPNDIFIAKTKDLAFCGVKLSANSLDDRIVQEWINSTYTIDDWTFMFNAIEEKVSSSTSHEELTAKDITDQLEVTTQAFLHKTPGRKRKGNIEEFLGDLKLPSYKRQFTANSDTSKFSMDDFKRTLEIIDENIDDLFKGLGLLKQLLAEEKISSDMTALANELKLEHLVKSLGEKPTALDADFEAPTVWLTMTNLATHIVDMRESIPSAQDITKFVEEKIEALGEKVNTDVKFLHQRINPAIEKMTKLEKAFIQIIQQLRDELHLEAERIDRLEFDIGNKSGINHDGSDNGYDNITSKLSELEGLIHSLRAADDSQAINFGGLGFKSSDESNSFLEEQVPDDEQKFGLVVDFHIVMENLYQHRRGNDLLKKMESIFKIKVPTVGQASSISSFERTIPKYFVTGVNDDFTPIEDDESYFNNIQTWQDWDTQHKGNRDKIIKQLEAFRKSHTRFIQQTVPIDSKIYTIAILALTESIAWVEGLMKFIDDTHKEYMRSKFSCKKSWAVATRLATALMEKIAEPRVNLYNTFVPGDAG